MTAQADAGYGGHEWSLDAMAKIARTLLLHYGHDPRRHPDLVDKLERILDDELLDIARQVLTEAGLQPSEWPLICPEHDVTPSPAGDTR